ncbi:RNA methyltransferase, putative [Plasmodium gaboni]|uniref:RNA methyltransferase, putative n=1 Tax=Plasmodium gaboni TaxID=647221 RepID=A0ABY1UU10_9APIC|nr:RNA methyltransferase, putative [Plasmodium gaboni]
MGDDEKYPFIDKVSKKHINKSNKKKKSNNNISNEENKKININNIEENHKIDNTKEGNIEQLNVSLNDDIKNSITKRIPNISRDLKLDVCVAIPSTIINNKSDVIKSYLTSFLARIFTIFSISKIYIYDDYLEQENLINKQKNYGDYQNEKYKKDIKNNSNNINKNMHNNIKKDPNDNDQNGFDNIVNNEKNKEESPQYSYLCKYMHYNLQYLETPQYLRKHLFPITNFLKNSGIMNPVDAPHHLRSDEWLPFREGVVLQKSSNGIIVDVGLFSNVLIENVNYINIGTRVTVLFQSNSYELFQKKNPNVLFTGKLIHPSVPKLYNLYWGYSIEILKNLSDIFKLQVDYLIGTSERGKFIDDTMVSFRDAKSVLIVFGNKDGLEDLLIKEKEKKKNKIFSPEKKVKVLNKMLKKFDLFINTCPCQTSRTIRTEEAITITLSLLHNILK